ncbi:hypothetical protein ACJW31_11G102100 [Castanea mollissima]
MDLPLLLLKVTFTIALVGFVSKKASIKTAKARDQIRGPPPSFLLGNIIDMKMMKSNSSKTPRGEQAITHSCSSALFPFFELWSKEYGSTFMFSLGNIQILHMNHPDEINICTSLDLGKPSYQHKERGPLLGQGILTSNGATWAHQRKILAPELYMEKVKVMMNLMVEFSITVVNSWTNLIESEGGVAVVHVDEYMRSFSGDVISRACFGSNYSKGEEIFLKLRELQEKMSKKVLFSGIPVVKERKERASENDLLQMIIKGASNSDFGQDETDRFIVDNCKNIYLAGYETTAVSAAWTLMLLASNPEWQQRVRSEVLEICADQMPNADMVRKMKTLTMVIQESLRLYPPVPVVSREAFRDMKFGDINVPKGVNVWTLMVSLHQDPDIWVPDANIFNPERFANGVSGSCKLPYVYMPFRVGPRTCLGQNFAMAELKILLAFIVSDFSFSLSPKYRHSPALKLTIEPEDGVNLHIKL